MRLPRTVATLAFGSMALMSAASAQGPSVWEDSGPLVTLFAQYRADRDSLGRVYPLRESTERDARFRTFYQQWLDQLEALDHQSLPLGGQADAAILASRLRASIADIDTERARTEEALVLVPFMPLIDRLQTERSGRGAIPAGQESGELLAELAKAVREQHQTLQRQIQQKEDLPEPNVAGRSLSVLRGARRVLTDWHGHFTGYVPEFTWWTARPYDDAIKALDAYIGFVDQQLVPDDDGTGPIPGDPIGEAALQLELDREMIAYTPDELIAIARREYEWVDKELVKYAKELGYDDWRDALEYVKTRHVPPGEQPTFVRELADKATEYLERHDLLTIPELAKETWRLDMMSPERQLVSPFFLGGETIIVSFPTDTMTHEQKLMSMRANNRHFSKATVHHELIPGHHLQFFMQSRYNTHRNGVTGTPFWIEGWALYWEFLLYKRGFPATPEDRIGFMFWRKHRCARIIFSLSFHMGRMTTQECVEMLVNEVGHERSTAEGEVRRSFGGSYPPLYQAAYMLGAFQLWELRRELVDTGQMPEKAFHDAIMQLNNMPWAVIREILHKREVPLDFKSDWKFYKGPAE